MGAGFGLAPPLTSVAPLGVEPFQVSGAWRIGGGAGAEAGRLREASWGWRSYRRPKRVGVGIFPLTEFDGFQHAQLPNLRPHRRRELWKGEKLRP